MTEQRVIIIGGGLAGLTAACECLERQTPVTILDKQTNLGGNSSKATCGIAAPGSELQKKLGVEDEGSDLLSKVDPSMKDMITTGAKDVDWLISMLGVESDLVLTKTPGHATARTLGTKKYFPGMVITYSAIQTLQKFAEAKPELLEIISDAEVKKLCVVEGKVTGVVYEKAKSATELKGPVVIATGGFAGDLSKDSVMAKHRPDLLKAATTNDERASGAGIKLGLAVGAATSKLSDVQLYPNAMALPGQDAGGLKFVASDALCSAGAVLLDATGARFCDEMAASDARVEAMKRAKAPFTLVLPKAKTDSVEWLCKFYTDKKVMTEMSDTQLATKLGVKPDSIKAVVGTGTLLTATVSPALYSCLGGLCVSETQEVLQSSGSAINGLFAAGEVSSAPCNLSLWSTSGVPLLYCVYSGRVAGKFASAALAGKEIPPMSLSEVLTAEIVPFTPAEKPLEELSKEELIAKVKQLQEEAKNAPPPSAEAAPAAPSGPAPITLDEVAKHKTADDAWIALNGQAIDVTRWIPKHPGGAEAIMQFLGQDCSEEWNMIHKPHFIDQYKDSYDIKGPIGVAGAAVAAGGPAPAADDGIPISEVEKHKSATDAWIAINGEVYDVTLWLKAHPGGEQAVFAFLGTDASEEWNGIHKPGTIEKYEPTPTGPKKVGKLAGGGGGPAPVADAGVQEKPRPTGDGGIAGWPGAAVFLVRAMVINLLATIFFTGNFVFSFNKERAGTIRSAIMLLTFTVVHVAGNSYDFWIGGSTQANGESYFFERQQGVAAVFKYIGAGPAELYIALAFLLHVAVALKRSWEITMNYCLYTGNWNMLLSGLWVLGFLIKHLQDFKFYQGYEYTKINPPAFPLMVNPLGALQGHLWTDPSQPDLVVKDVYSHQVAVFKDPSNLIFYLISVLIFVYHMAKGWKKVHTTDALQVPEDHSEKVLYMGYALAFSVGSLYASVALGTFLLSAEDVPHFAKPSE